MLGIGFTEMVVIAAIALMVIGPEKFPDFAKLVIRTIRDLRGYVDEMKQEVAKELKPLKDEVTSLSKIDPEKYIDSLTKEASESKPANPSLHEEDRKVMDTAASYEDDPYGWEGSSPGGYDTEPGSAPASTVGYGENTEDTGEPAAEAARNPDAASEAVDAADAGEVGDVGDVGDVGEAGEAGTADTEQADGDSEFEGLDALPKDSESNVWTGRQAD